MKLNLLKSALLLLIFSIFSCSKDEPTPAPVPDSTTFQYRVTKEEVLFNNGSTRENTYKYNQRNQIVELSSYAYGLSKYNYDISGFLIEIINETGISYTYTNGANGKVLEVIKIDGNAIEDKTVYTYDSAGNKTETKKYNFDSNTTTYYYVQNTIFNYNSKNQLESVFTKNIYNNVVTDSVLDQYEYDERGNRTKNIFAQGLLNNFPVRKSESTFKYDNIKPTNYLNSTLSKNNVIEEVYKTYLADGTTINTQTTTNYSHTYNEASYITKTIKNSTDVNQGMSTSKFTFEKIN